MTKSRRFARRAICRGGHTFRWRAPGEVFHTVDIAGGNAIRSPRMTVRTGDERIPRACRDDRPKVDAECLLRDLFGAAGSGGDGGALMRNDSARLAVDPGRGTGGFRERRLRNAAGDRVLPPPRGAGDA